MIVRLAKRVARKVLSQLDRADKALFGVSYERFHDLLRPEIVGHCASVIDVGCGEHSRVRPFLDELRFAVGVDAHLPSIVASRAARGHHAYCCMNIVHIGSTIAPKSFDCVLSVDVIEHLTKEKGHDFLRALEAIARKRLIIFTPNGFLPQHATPDNPFQEHISGWTADEMSALGYRVIGINGWRPLRGEYADPRRPRWLTERASLLTERWFESRPRNAFQILCVKEL